MTKPSRARKNMRRYAKKRGAKILDVPDVNSMFVLAPLKGKTQPVLAFLDSGCSDLSDPGFASTKDLSHAQVLAACS